MLDFFLLKKYIKDHSFATLSSRIKYGQIETDMCLFEVVHQNLESKVFAFYLQITPLLNNIFYHAITFTFFNLSSEQSKTLGQLTNV